MATSLGSSCRIGCKAIAASTILLGLAGCALPYLDTAQAAYRVDPVLVQWGSRTGAQPAGSQAKEGQAPSYGNPCPTVPKSEQGAMNARTPVDVLCPLDLDSYVFPQDLKRGTSAGAMRQTAYERVLACQEKIAPSELGMSLGHEIDRARAIRDELSQRKASLPAILAAEEEVLAAKRTAADDAAAALTEAQQRYLEAVTAAGAAKPEEKTRLDDELGKARTTLNSAQGQKATADTELAKQTKKVDDFKAEQAQLTGVQKDNLALIGKLEAQIRRVGDGGLVPEATATLLERRQEATCMALRNQLQEELIARSTQMCEKHLSDTEATASLFNATFGFGALTQSALAAVVTGKTLAQALSTGAAITTGTQAVINKEIYRNAVVPAIKRAIKAERERRLNLMRANQLRPLMEYQVGRAIGEAAAYHEACSFSTGLELIGNDAEKRVEQSIPDIESRVKALTDQIKTMDASITTTSTEAERRSAERSKLRLRQEIDILQSRLAGARQGGAH